MCKDNIIKILHKHKVKKLLISIHLQILAGHAAFIVHITQKQREKFASVLPLNEQPCRKRWRGGEEALRKVNKRHEGPILSLQRRCKRKYKYRNETKAC